MLWDELKTTEISADRTFYCFHLRLQFPQMKLLLTNCYIISHEKHLTSPLRWMCIPQNVCRLRGILLACVWFEFHLVNTPYFVSIVTRCKLDKCVYKIKPVFEGKENCSGNNWQIPVSFSLIYDFFSEFYIYFPYRIEYVFKTSWHFSIMFFD